MRHLCLYILTALVCAAEPDFATNNDFFAQGMDDYRAGNFPEATRAFEQSVAQHPSAGALVNLGITQWQRGHAGAAILAWEQARWINPYYDQANSNLEFARQVAQVSEPELKWYEIPSTWLPPNSWVWLAGASLWLAAGAAILPGLLRRRKSDRQQTLAALGLAAFLFCFTANLGVVSRTQIGFVLGKDAPLLLTPTTGGEVVATLTDGEPGRILRQHGMYWLIQTADGTGWIARQQFGLVVPE